VRSSKPSADVRWASIQETEQNGNIIAEKPDAPSAAEVPFDRGGSNGTGFVLLPRGMGCAMTIAFHPDRQRETA